MVQKVLVPMDHSPLAEDALEFAFEEYPDCEIIVFHVVDYIEESYAGKLLVGPEELRERGRERTDELFETARSIAEDHDREIRTVLEFGKPGREILEFADEENVDLIVIGSHGRSIVSRFVIGDVAQTVVERAEMPVTVVR